ncbi:MAG: hypothetical protein NTX86_01120 [Candidatus Dependentiae bacterium]|nr:hypothetical protein [Candidatus Dependentiae bacterium]
MKNINFINALPARTYKKIKHWTRLCFTGLAAMLVAMAVVHFKQYADYKRIKGERASLERQATLLAGVAERHKALQEQDIGLNTRLAVLERYTTEAQNPSMVMTQIKLLLGNKGFLESFTLNNDQISLMLRCSQCDMATLMGGLRQIPGLQGLTLTAVQPKQVGPDLVLQVSIKGTLARGA